MHAVKGGDAGHVAAIGSGIFVDLSIDQASRPQRRIDLRPFWIRILSDEKLAEFKANEIDVLYRQAGCLLRYFYQGGTPFLRSRDCLLEERTRPIVDWIIRQVELKKAKAGRS